MILAIVAIVVGLVLLVWSADRFVDGAVGVAQFFGMSTFLIGMLVVGFGTSAPEMVVSVLSALNDTPQLALGNAYGSNIANIALILGTTALIAPVIVKKQAVKRDIPILIATTVLTIVLVKDGNVSLFDGVVLLLAFVAITVFNISMELRDKRKRKNEDAESEPAEKVSIVKAFAWLLVGLALLIASSRMLVWGAVYMAQALGVSDLLIGLTIVAVGTSLPVFNTLVVVGIAAVITPIKAMDAEVLSRDLPIVSALTLLLFFICIPFKKKNGKRVSGFGRIGGAFFLSLYIAYLVLLGIQSV